jgi:hypothetical protein
MLGILWNRVKCSLKRGCPKVITFDLTLGLIFRFLFISGIIPVIMSRLHIWENHAIDLNFDTVPPNFQAQSSFI